MFHIPSLSFYSGDLYWDVCHKWRGRGFLYLFLLLAVCWIPRAIMIQSDIAAFVEIKAPPIVEQIPPITFFGGEASMDVNQPYFILDPKSQKTLAIIDTTGEITSLAEQEALCLVTKNELIMRGLNQSTNTLSFEKYYANIDFTLDRYEITQTLEGLRRMTGVLLYPVALFCSYFSRVIQVLLYALIGLQFTRRLESQFSYVSLLRLSVVAMTPAIIVKTMLGVADIQIPLPGVCYFLAAMCCLFFGIKSATIEEEGKKKNDGQSTGMSHIE